MTTLHEGRHTGEHLLSEANGTLSRESVTVTQSGTALPPGQVLGKITASGKFVPYNNAASNGSEVAAAILYAPLEAATGDTKATVHVRHCEVVGAMLTGIDAPGKVDLAALGIITR
ncbi:MAG: head decoration protein [Hydrogenophaga sp.]|nr:head decoration protein [Hydrogenophaga sp.]